MTFVIWLMNRKVRDTVFDAPTLQNYPGKMKMNTKNIALKVKKIQI